MAVVLVDGEGGDDAGDVSIRDAARDELKSVSDGFTGGHDVVADHFEAFCHRNDELCQL